MYEMIYQISTSKMKVEICFCRLSHKVFVRNVFRIERSKKTTTFFFFKTENNCGRSNTLNIMEFIIAKTVKVGAENKARSHLFKEKRQRISKMGFSVE